MPHRKFEILYHHNCISRHIFKDDIIKLCSIAKFITYRPIYLYIYNRHLNVFKSVAYIGILLVCPSV